MKQPSDWTPWEREFYQLARGAWSTGDYMLRGLSGSDRSESEIYFELRKCYIEIAALGPEISKESLEAVIASADGRWRTYAAQNNEKVDGRAKDETRPIFRLFFNTLAVGVARCISDQGHTYQVHGLHDENNQTNFRLKYYSIQP